MKRIVLFSSVPLALLLAYYFWVRVVDYELVEARPVAGVAGKGGGVVYLNAPGQLPRWMEGAEVDFEHYDYLLSYGRRVRWLVHNKFFSQGFSDPPAVATAVPLSFRLLGPRCDTVFLYRLPLNPHYRPAEPPDME